MDRHGFPLARVAGRGAALLAVVLAGCAAQPVAQPVAAADPVTFVAFGDAGEHYDYLEAEVLADPLTPEEFEARWREEWIEDKRPIADFALPATWVLPQTGGTIEASGLFPVAAAMKRFCAKERCDFATMLGDNIYPDGATAGADGRDDAERFRRILIEPFAGLAQGRPDFRIYSTLGNHDWKTSREGALAQVRFLERTPPFYMDGLLFRVRPPAARGLVEIFSIDTEVLLATTTVYEDRLDADGREVRGHGEIDEPEAGAVPANDLERNMASWLEEALASSDARWKIVIGHHPIWSSAGSKYEQARALRSLILPSLCRHADMYLAGHDHTLELHHDRCLDEPSARGRAPLLHVVSGAGAKQRPLHRAFAAHQQRENPQLETLWAEGLTWGFAHLTLDGDVAIVQMVTTPNDKSGVPEVAFTHRAPRRSAGG